MSEHKRKELVQARSQLTHILRRELEADLRCDEESKLMYLETILTNVIKLMNARSKRNTIVLSTYENLEGIVEPMDIREAKIRIPYWIDGTQHEEQLSMHATITSELVDIFSKGYVPYVDFILEQNFCDYFRSIRIDEYHINLLCDKKTMPWHRCPQMKDTRRKCAGFYEYLWSGDG